jgi:single-stranded-DNA-specific exonuclease
VAESNARGIDVIITDHHRVPVVLPDAFAIVNPHRPDSIYPDRRLAGSGVAFKVAQLILAGEPGGPAAALELTDLATIGSVADVAPVVGENRAIARLGLERMRRAPRPGIAALLERARVAPAAVDLETVSFAIAPRLNAAGRVGEALEAARLLLAGDAVEAAAHADALEAANLTRRDLMKTAVGEARTAVAAESGEPATVVRGPWTVGIVGLVAARLVEDRGRPAVVGADLGDVVRASCRSGGSLDLGATLEHCSDLFIRFGGHAGAAGFEIAADRWDEFRSRFLALAAESVPPDPRLAIAVDLALPALDVDYALYRELAGLAPCGPGNVDPLVAVLGLTVTRVRAATGGHTQLTLRRGLDVLDGIAFGRSDIAEAVREGDRLDVVARLTSRSFGGFESLQLDIRDVATSGSHPRTAAVLAAHGDATVLAGTAS